MDIFTDASFDAKNKLAGVAAVYVTPNAEKKNPFVFTVQENIVVANVHSAEMWAMAFALNHLSVVEKQHVRVFTDSKRAGAFIHTGSYVDDMGLKALRDIESSCARIIRQGGTISFYQVLGHQKGAAENTYIAYNKLADRLSKTARNHALLSMKQANETAESHAPKKIKSRNFVPKIKTWSRTRN